MSKKDNEKDIKKADIFRACMSFPVNEPICVHSMPGSALADGSFAGFGASLCVPADDDSFDVFEEDTSEDGEDTE